MDKTVAQERKGVLDAYWQVLRYSPKYPGVQAKIKEIQAIK